MNTKKVAVVGAGSWGTAVANVMADGGAEVTIWGRDTATIDAIRERHENEKYLKGYPLHPALGATVDLDEALEGAGIVVCSIPTQGIRSVFMPIREKLSGRILINTSKGIELGTHRRVSEIFHEINPQLRYAVLSGPTFAQEVIRRLPAAATVAADRDVATEIQKVLSTNYFRVYTSTDVGGVEIAGALKNVVAIATGMVDGLKLGYNAQAAIINRGIAEMMRMGKLVGAEPLTFLGLSGMGDLVLTCTGPLSRNRTLGMRLGAGKKIDDITKELGGVAEGMYTARSAFELAARHRLEMPITEQVYRIIYENSTPQQALVDLMNRGLKPEWEVGQEPNGK